MNDVFSPSHCLCDRVTHLASPVDVSAGEMNYGTFASLIRFGLSQGPDAAAMMLEFYSVFNTKYKSCAFLSLKTLGCFDYGAHLLRE